MRATLMRIREIPFGIHDDPKVIGSNQLQCLSYTLKTFKGSVVSQRDDPFVVDDVSPISAPAQSSIPSARRRARTPA
jgi:hypothetical protein